MAKDVTQLKQLLRGLFAAKRLAALATHHDGQPYQSLVAFAATDDLKHMVFATTRATRKFRNISADTRVALLVDSCTDQTSDFHDEVAVTATGRAVEVAGAERDRLLALHLARHPYLKEFATSPTCAVLRVDVDTYYICERFEHVSEFQPDPGRDEGTA